MESKIIILIIFVIVVYVVVELLAAALGDTDNMLYEPSIILHTKCMYSDPKFKKIVHKSRGSGYVLNANGLENQDLILIYNEEKEKLENCLLTPWAFTHIVLYTILGFILPEYWYILIPMGCIYEVYEYYHWNGHDYLDIMYNSLGVLLGVSLNNVMAMTPLV